MVCSGRPLPPGVETPRDSRLLEIMGARHRKDSVTDANISRPVVHQSFTGSIGRGMYPDYPRQQIVPTQRGAKRLATFDLLASPADGLAF